MNGSTLTLGFVAGLAAAGALASVPGRRGSHAKAALPQGMRAHFLSDEDLQPGDEARITKSYALAKKVNLGILRDKNLRLVVQKGSKVVGALFDSLGGDHYSFDIVVDPSTQGSGVGRWLMNAGDDMAREYEDMGYPTVLEAVNPIAQAALLRRGFTVLERGPGHAVLTRGDRGDTGWSG